MEMTRQLSGQSLPRTVSGRAALVDQLPHHISCDALQVDFLAEPGLINRFLPPGLEADGRGWVMAAEMIKVSGNHSAAAWRDPVTTTYNECVVGFHVRYGSKVGRYSAFVWVDRDWSLGMGPIFGWPKRMAAVNVSRFNDTHPTLKTRGPGSHMGGVVAREGRRVLNLSVDVPNAAEELSELPSFGDATFLYRYIASPGEGIAASEDLLEMSFSNVKMAGVYRGVGELEFHDSPSEELTELGAIEVREGYVYRRGWTTDATAKIASETGVEQ